MLRASVAPRLTAECSVGIGAGCAWAPGRWEPLTSACGFYSGPCPPAISSQLPTARSLLGHTPASLGLGFSLKILVGARWVPHRPMVFTSLVTILTGLESGEPPTGRSLRPDSYGLRALNTFCKSLAGVPALERKDFEIVKNICNSNLSYSFKICLLE